ncbi:MAG: DUF2339 domain-containing protein [Bacteroidota bacterium]
MKVICKQCHSENPSTHLFCSNCGYQLISTQEAVKRLNNRISQIESTYQRQINEVKSDLQKLAQHKETAEEVKIPQPAPQPVFEKEIVVPQQAVQPIPVPKSKPKTVKVKQPPKPRVPSEPSVFEQQLALLFKPVTDGLGWINGQYLKYKKEGKLPIFLMTIAGIIAMLFGLGYLMQVTLDKMGIYEPVIKVGLGFVVAVVLAVIGMRLYRKKDQYNEYASGLASLSIIINYVLIYFLADLGNFPVLSSALMGFVLILCNTAFAIFLSLRFETKIVAVLSLVGGALAPFFLNSTEDSTLYYGYLWLLVVAANYVAVKIEWKFLHYLSFMIAVGIMGVAVFTAAPATIVFFIYYHLFAYLFFYYSFFRKFQWKEHLGKVETFLLAGNMSFFLYSLYAAYDTTMLMLGITYAVNALVFAVVAFIAWKKLSDQLKRILPVVVATFLALAIPALLDQGLMGLFWSVEALLLVHLGFTTKLPVVRKEGYLLLLIGIGKIAYSSLFFFAEFTSLRHEGFYNFTALGLVLLALWLQSANHKKALQMFERGFYYLFRNGFPVWLSVWMMVAGYQLIGNWVFPLSVVPLFALSWWGSKLKSTFLVSFSFLYLFPLLLAYLISCRETGTLFFDQQRLYAQISIVLLMASLWYSKSYYQLIGQQEKGLVGFAQMLRILFFLIISLIPITFARRHVPELIPAAGWLSLLISFAFYKKLRYLALQIEFAILFVLAFVATFFELTVPVLGAGILVLVIIHLVERSYNEEALKKSDFGITLQVSPYVVYLFLAALSFVIFDFDFLFYPTLIFLTCTLVSVWLKDRLAFIRDSAGGAISFSIALSIVIAFFMLIDDVLFAHILLFLFDIVLIAIVFLNKKRWYSSFTSIKWSIDFVFYQLLLVLTYWSMLSFLDINADGAVMTVLLTVHAVALLFLALKNKLKLLNYLSIIIFSFTTLKIVFSDIASLPITQKVVVLIALGALLLGASYAYTRLKKYFDDKDQQAFNEKLIAEEELKSTETTDDQIS